MKRATLLSSLITCCIAAFAVLPTAHATPSTPKAGITMLSTGKAPKRVLRYAPKQGAVERTLIEMKMTMAMGMAGGPMQAMPIPTITMNAKVATEKVHANGDFDHSLTFEVPTLKGGESAMNAAMKDALAGMSGMTITQTTSSTGALKKTELNLPPNANPQLKQTMESMQKSLEQMLTYLPTEAVGVGASWKNHQPVSQNGMNLHQTITMTIVKLEGSKVHVDFSLVQGAEAQDMKTPNMPAGSSARLTRLEGSGKGSSVIDLNQVMPSTSTMSVDLEMDTTVKMMGTSQDMRVKTNIDMKLSTKKGAAK